MRFLHCYIFQFFALSCFVSVPQIRIYVCQQIPSLRHSKSKNLIILIRIIVLWTLFELNWQFVLHIAWRFSSYRNKKSTYIHIIHAWHKYSNLVIPYTTLSTWYYDFVSPWGEAIEPLFIVPIVVELISPVRQ